MAEATATRRGVQAGSQNARILAVLWDRRWHTVPEIHRKAGTSRLNSRISELRGHGCEIESRRNPGRKGASAYSYRLVSAPDEALRWLGAAAEQHDEWVRLQAEAEQRRSEVPRDGSHRFRLYGVRDGGVLDILGTAETPEEIGLLLVALGEAGELRGVCVGLLDTHGTDTARGSWTINPWEGR